MATIIRPFPPTPTISNRTVDKRITSQPAEEELLGLLGLTTLKALLEFEPVIAARAVLAISLNGRPTGDLKRLVTEKFLGEDVTKAASWPIAALSSVHDKTAAILVRFGIVTIAALANFGPRMRAEALLDGFAEQPFYQSPPSAPDELMPKMTGAITSLYRYNSFIRDRDLRNLRIFLDKACAPETILTQIFEESTLPCPVLYLGRLAGYTQQWVLQGTYLGEVMHSLSLAPGESRNIAIVDWRRAQRTGRDEDTVGAEDLSHFARHNRSLDETASGVASEHQWGQTETAAVTAAGGLAAVAAAGVVGGVGGALGGAALGSIVAGVGAVPGALAGAAVGGFAGVASAGIAVAGAGALGMIRADTNGDRDVEGTTAQDIMLTTRQKSSVERSLRSSVVLEDVQEERDHLQTSTVTNYNHMHALTMQYYEILHRYAVSIKLDSLEPLLFLPFGTLPFDAKNIKNLWPFIRILFEDGEMVRLIDEKLGYAQMKIEKIEVEVPEEPLEPGSPSSLEIKKVEVAVKVSQGFNAVSARLSWWDDIGAARIDDLKHISTQAPRTLNFDSSELTSLPLSGTQIKGIDVTLDQAVNIETDVEVLVRATQKLEGQAGEDTASIVLTQQTFFPASNPSDSDRTKHFPWNATSGLSATYEEYLEAKRVYDEAVEAENEAQKEYEEAVQERSEAQDDALTNLLLLANGRRFALTREYIQRAEPEVLAILLDAIVISDGNYELPLHRIAHSVPIAIAGSFLILRMKRHWDRELPFSKVPDSRTIQIRVLPDLARLIEHPQWVIDRWERLHDRPLSADIVDLPTSGLFAEAILGRSNAAEKLDLTRHVAWHEMPIPHQPPAIAPLTLGSRVQSQDATPSALPNTINIVNPPTFPEPTGLAEAFATLRTSDMFRDMSKAGELAGIIGNLTQLAGSLGQAATEMTGDAAARALQSAGDIGEVAAGLANQAMIEGARSQSEIPSQTSLGSRINALKEQQSLATEPEDKKVYGDNIRELLSNGGYKFASTAANGSRDGGSGGSQESPSKGLLDFALKTAGALGTGLLNWSSDPEGELSDALKEAMLEAAKKEIKDQGETLAKRIIPMGGAFLAFAKLSLAFGYGAGEKLQQVNSELRPLYAKLESKIDLDDTDALSQDEIDALRTLTGYQNIAVSKLPRIVRAGIDRAGTKAIEMGADAVKKLLGDNVMHIAEELAENKEVIALFSATVEEGRSQIPMARKTIEERLISFMITAFLKQLPKSKFQTALGVIVEPVRNSQPVVIEIMGGLANALVQGALQDLGPHEETVKKLILDYAGNPNASRNFKDGRSFKEAFDAVGTLEPSGGNHVEIDGTIVRAPQSVIVSINNAAGTPDQTLFEVRAAGDIFRVLRDMVEMAIQARAFELQRQYNYDPTPQKYNNLEDKLATEIGKGAQEINSGFVKLQIAVRTIFEAAGDTTHSEPNALQTFIRDELYLENKFQVWQLVRSQPGIPQARNTKPHNRGGRLHTRPFLPQSR